MKYLIIFIALVSMYGFEFKGVQLYKNGEYLKAQKSFEKYISKTNSTVAKAFLAKIYYKEKKYQKSEKLIKELLNNDTLPSNVKKELKTYLALIKGVKWLKADVAVGVLYDSNVNYAKKDTAKKDDFAHIEEAKIKGFYLKNNFEVSFDAKAQNRGYIFHPEYNYVYVDANAYLTYYSFINSRYKIGYEMKTNGSNYLYKNELYFFKQFGNYQTGVVGIGNYYVNEGLEAKDLGGGLRFGFITKNFETYLSALSYFSDVKENELDNRNYKFEIKSKWHVQEAYLEIHYFYNVSIFDSYKTNLHYLDASFNTKESKHFYYSVGITNYYSLAKEADKELRKYEFYLKFIYDF